MLLGNFSAALTSIDWRTLFFGIVVLLSALFQLYLIKRQINVVYANKNQIPKYFIQKITLQDHQKSTDYSLAQLYLQQYRICWSTMLILISTIFGGLNVVTNLASALVIQAGIFRELMLILIFIFCYYLLTLPLIIYRIFWVETKFGFNHATLQSFLKDQLKIWIIGCFILLPLILIIFLFRSTGQFGRLYAWLFWLVSLLVVLWTYPKYIAPLFNRFTPLDDSALKLRIETLLHRTGFKSNGIFVMDGSKRSSHSNAYFSGFGKHKRIVFYDVLLRQITPKEFEAILSHELGHFKLKHGLKQMLFTVFMIVMGIGVWSRLLNNHSFYSGLGINLEYVSYGMKLLLVFLLSPVFTFILSPVWRALSRQHEYAADQFAAQTTSADNLISALVKLYKGNATSFVTDKCYSFFYDSHPSLEDRIKALESIKSGV